MPLGVCFQAERGGWRSVTDIKRRSLDGWRVRAVEPATEAKEGCQPLIDGGHLFRRQLAKHAPDPPLVDGSQLVDRREGLLGETALARREGRIKESVARSPANEPKALVGDDIRALLSAIASVSSSGRPRVHSSNPCSASSALMERVAAGSAMQPGGRPRQCLEFGLPCASKESSWHPARNRVKQKKRNLFLLGMVSVGGLCNGCAKTCGGMRRGVRLPDSERFARAAETGANAMFYTEAKRIKTRGEEKACEGRHAPVT